MSERLESFPISTSAQEMTWFVKLITNSLCSLQFFFSFTFDDDDESKTAMATTTTMMMNDAAEISLFLSRFIYLAYGLGSITIDQHLKWAVDLIIIFQVVSNMKMRSMPFFVLVSIMISRHLILEYPFELMPNIHTPTHPLLPTKCNIDVWHLNQNRLQLIITEKIKWRL